MKKITLLFIALMLSVASQAQSISFSLITTPCNHDGVLSATVTGMTPPLTFIWHVLGGPVIHTGTGTTDLLTAYSGAPIGLTVTSATDDVYNYFAGAPPFTFTITATSSVCPALGSIGVAVGAGTPPYTYEWYKLPLSASVGTTNPLFALPGSYCVEITDAAGCKYDTRESSGYDTIGYTAPFGVTVTSTDANCTDGTASIAVASGTAVSPVSYEWSTGASTATISGLSAGYYGVTATDALGCVSGVPLGSSTMGYAHFAMVNQTVIVNTPTTATPATCTALDGAIAVFPTGGVPPYTFLWSNGAITASQSGLAPGSYGITVTDVNGCTGSSSSYISATTPVMVTFTSTPSSCTTPTGTATLTVLGGTAPYTIEWLTSPLQFGLTATSLPPGSYAFKVTDAVGCIRTGTVTVPPVNVIAIPYIATAPTCTLSNGAINLTPSGGATPYTYLWSTGATTASLASVPAGLYTVSVTDNAGCKASRNIYLYSHSPVDAVVATTPASCIFTADGSLTAVPFGGTPPYTFSWTGGGSTSTISGKLTGDYWVGITDAIGCHVARFTHLDYNHATTSCYCTIEGIVYHDVNGNCMQDAGEPGINNVQIRCSGRGYTYTDASGHYSFKVPSGSYIITQTVQTFYPLAACQLNNIPVTAVAASGCVLPVNFANSINPIHDVHISTWDYTFAVPGNMYNTVSVVSNDGTVAEPAVFAGYKPDGQLLAPSFVPAGIFTGSSFYYNTPGTFPALTPGSTQTFIMNYNVPTYVPLGTVVVFKDSAAHQAPMSTWLTDYSPANNVNYFTTTVVASYDPNFKEVNPKGSGPFGIIQYSDSVLEYMVHFQNTGSWYAQNIIVLDTIEEDLDWTTLKPVYQSAPCQVTLTESGPYKIAKFSFENIHLPPQSFDDLRSNGMFTFTIKTKPGLPPGTRFENSAAIYFDYNAPIITNSTLNTLVEVNGVAGGPNVPPHSALTVYPNPANNTFNAIINSEKDNNASLTVFDIAGKVQLSKVIALTKGTQTITTDINQLAPGVYFVTLNNNGAIQTQKLVVIK
ncbi:MAG: T9SS type A sorting domain-containing protein [Bacteroidota bacterium]